MSTVCLIPFERVGGSRLRLRERILVIKLGRGGDVWRKVVVVINEAIPCCQNEAKRVLQHDLETLRDVCEVWTTVRFWEPA